MYCEIDAEDLDPIFWRRLVRIASLLTAVRVGKRRCECGGK